MTETYNQKCIYFHIQTLHIFLNETVFFSTLLKEQFIQNLKFSHFPNIALLVESQGIFFN